MNDKIEIFGIETNNLKNIDVSLQKNAINLIIGPSGSGKSSLAYDTIAQIGKHEFFSMFADEVFEPSYRVRSYQNMMAVVPISQSNHNNNMRSTIGTYFGQNRNVAHIYSAMLEISEDFFVLNKESNLCEHCKGIGFISTLDENRILDYDIPIVKNPIKCWNKYKDFYSEILKQFSIDKEIDPKYNFRQLSKREKDLILFGQSEEKYSIKFRKNKAYSRRTSKYYGVMTNTPMMPKFSPSKKFYSEKECAFCKGRKYSSIHEQYKLFGLSIGEFMVTPFNKLSVHIDKMLQEIKDEKLNFAVRSISDFIAKANELNLGHLYLNRAIPTLSGGELQRLRLVQVFNTQLSDLLIVLDEPLAGLSGDEKISVYQNVVELSKHHTLLIVEHSDIFVKDSKVIIALGEKSGKNGGNIIDVEKYIKTQNIHNDYSANIPKNLIQVTIKNQVYQYIGIDIRLAVGDLNLISGKSGVGKSTILREYLPQYFEHYTYINQKPLLGNKNSCVATVLDIFSNITDAFAKKHNKDKRFFSNLTGCEGSCPTCSGAGYLEYGNEMSGKMRLECSDCEGTGFHKNLKRYLFSGKSIFDVWVLTLDEAIEFFKNTDKKAANTLIDASCMMLGHLKVGQPTSTLSGGENIRIKVLKTSRSKSSLFGIDEPFKGLNNTEIYSVVKFLEGLAKENKTVIVADHNEDAFKYFSNHVELIDNDGVLMT